ncbi:MAG: nucleotidyl transferase AbiEii/AbiGii toxin family protein [Anaerolineae bacterium]|nr:nucleotidyl transferase AbiEii/AbiGii toxin family protein [Anaerolineae bacterium]
MTALHWETITPLMRQVMTTLGQSDLAGRFYLAGGTALALQLGHRRSIDLNMFSATAEVRPETHRQALNVLRSFQPDIVEQEWGNLLLVIETAAESLHVGFFGYGYRLLEPTVPADGLPLAGLIDIGLMKLDALASRASRKDFYDLYALAQRIPLRDLFAQAPAKYPNVRDFEAMVVRYMAYFDRADQEAEPILFDKIGWEEVKAFFRDQARQIGRAWLE